jgi:uncharacterized protein (TIRG00374 family)
VKKKLLASFKVIISLAGIGFIFFIFKDRWNEVVAVLKSLKPSYFLVGMAVYIGALAIITARLSLLLKVQNIRIPFQELCYFTAIGQFFSLFLPSAIGGDVVKGFYIYKHSGKKVPSFTSIFLDRFVGSLAILSFGLAALIYYGKSLNLGNLTYWVMGLFAAMLVALYIMLHKDLGGRLSFLAHCLPSQKLKEIGAHIFNSVNYYRHHKAVLAKSYAISLVSQTCFISIFFVLALSLGLNISLFQFFLVIPIVAALSMAPSINGLGVREAGFVYLMGFFTSSENALALALLQDGLIYGAGILFGVLYMVREGFRSEVIREAIRVEDEVEELEAEDFGGAAKGE